MTRKKKHRNITFFTPNMNRTGSEIALFNLINKLDPGFKAAVITKYKGDLLDLLPSRIERDVLFKAPVKFKLPLRSYTLTKLYEHYHSRIVFYIKTFKYRNTVWYVNTIVLPEVIKYAKKHNIKVIAYVHEREGFFERLSPRNLSILINYPSLIIANSNITAKVLSDFGRKNGVAVCYPILNTYSIVKDKSVYSSFRKKLGIPDNVFLWIMVGSMDENKNPLLFIDVAKEVLKQRPDAMFMWIGASGNKLYERCIRKVEEQGLQNRIIWLENVGADYYNYFNCADGFVLTSLNESFSLVTVEALLLELPIVAIDCGGVREILNEDYGTIINGNNPVMAMAQAMTDYMDGKIGVDAVKARARARVFDSDLWAAKWNSLLIDFFNKNV